MLRCGMATTTPWLPGWQAVRPRRRAAGARAIPAAPGPHLARGERALLTRAGVVATDRALYRAAAVDGGPTGGVPDQPPVAGEWTRLGWEQVARADPHDHGLVLTAWAPGTPPRTVIAVPRAAPLLALARERIAWTTLIATRVEIAGHPARVAARRVPASDEVVWLVALDPAVPRGAPVAAELEAALARLRREFARP